MSTPAVTQPDPAPATSELDIPSGAAYDQWRLKGTLPSEADPAPAVEPETEVVAPQTDDSAPSLGDTAAAPPAAPPQKKRDQKTREDTERRFNEILSENRSLRQKIEEAEQRRTAAPSAPPASQPAAAKAEPKLEDVDPQTGRPKYTTLQDFIVARETWLKENLLSEFETRSAKTQAERAQQEQARVLNEGLNAKYEVARAKYADFDQVALNPDLLIPAGSVADTFVLDSEHGADVLHYLGQHPEVLESFYGNFDLKTGKYTNKVNPLRQARELFKIEQKFATGSSSVRRVSNAPPPPHEVSGKGTTSSDEVEQALKDDDTAAYFATANRRDIARRKGK